MVLVLASDNIEPLARFEPADSEAGDRVVVVPTAANPLPDRDTVVTSLLEQAGALGLRVEVLDLDRATPADLAAIERAAAVVVGGGDPFHLLAAARRHDFATFVSRALARGAAYGGVSAGAMLAAPTLAPVPAFSPFSAPAGDDLTGMGVAPLLVLPHDDRPGRRAKHELALRRFGRDVDMLAIADGEYVVVPPADPLRRRLEAPSLGASFRFGDAHDADAMAEVFDVAARTAWASFLGADRLAGAPGRASMFAERIAAGTPRDVVLAEDADGVVGFVWVHAGAEPTTGEVDLFYTHPRAWGSGIGRRLMQLGLDELRARGFVDAVLWTEERNERPRRVYERGGWTLDGSVRDREYLGVPIHELRHRRAL